MLRLLVPAKINLDLRVGAARADGFHPLSSWFVTVGFYDELIFDTHPLPGIHLSCDHPELAVDGRNLVVRAASDLMLSLPEDDPARHAGVSIRLAKRIPTGGGLGGGSADAAYTLLGITRLMEICCGRDHLDKLAARLGSDVNFFLHGPSALCTGRGEVVDPLPTVKPGLTALLILPTVKMPTAQVYREFDQLKMGRELPGREAERQRYTAMAQLSAGELLSALVNDLEKPSFALSRELGELRQEAERKLGRPVRMSGSGSTLFSLYDTPEEASTQERAAMSWLPAGTRVACVEVCPSPART